MYGFVRNYAPAASVLWNSHQAVADELKAGIRVVTVVIYFQPTLESDIDDLTKGIEALPEGIESLQSLLPQYLCRSEVFLFYLV
jgi:hypothetical protein